MSRLSDLTLLFFYWSRHNVFDVTLTDNFQHHEQSVDTVKYPYVKIKGKMVSLSIKFKTPLNLCQYKILLKKHSSKLEISEKHPNFKFI